MESRPSGPINSQHSSTQRLHAAAALLSASAWLVLGLTPLLSPAVGCLCRSPLLAQRRWCTPPSPSTRSYDPSASIGPSRSRRTPCTCTQPRTLRPQRCAFPSHLPSSPGCMRCAAAMWCGGCVGRVRSFAAADFQHLRVSVSSFMDILILATRTLATFNDSGADYRQPQPATPENSSHEG